MAVKLVAGAIVAAVSITITTCGSSDAPQPELVACDVLRSEDLETVLQGAVGRPTASGGGASDALAGRSGCAWSTSDHSKAVLIELVRTDDMARQVRRTGFSAEARFAAARSQYPSAKDQPEVSREAIYVEEAATLHILEGSSYLTIEVAVTPPSMSEPTAAALGRRAVARLRGSGNTSRAGRLNWP